LLLYLHYYAATLFDPLNTDLGSAQDCPSSTSRRLASPSISNDEQ
jgi:hypothetical protein